MTDLYPPAVRTWEQRVSDRLGKRRQDNSDEPDKSHTNALQGATLGLLALLLGFTFAMAVSRFDNRKSVIMEQANAIGTAELRSRLLGAPFAAYVARLTRAGARASRPRVAVTIAQRT